MTQSASTKSAEGGSNPSLDSRCQSPEDFLGTWHTSAPFLERLLQDLQDVDDFLNLDSMKTQVESLLDYSYGSECNCGEPSTGSSDDETDTDDETDKGDEADMAYCPHERLKSDRRSTPYCVREFVVLEQVGPKIIGAITQLSEIRDRIATRVVATKKDMERGLGFLDESGVRRALKKFPPDVKFRAEETDLVETPLTDLEDESISQVVHENTSRLGVLLQRLPIEILYSIILHAQATDPHISFTMSQVNQYFRTLVNTSPLLWSTLNLMYPPPLTNLCLERSSNAHLDVIARDSSVGYTSTFIRRREIAKMLAFFEELRPHRQRIQRLTIDSATSVCWGPDVPFMVPLQASIRGLEDHFLWGSEFASLHYLELRFECWEPMTEMNLPVLGNLRELRLYGPWPTSLLSLVSESLQHLTLGDQSIRRLEDLTKALSSTQGLESLTISDMTSHDVPPESRDIVDLGSLKRLSIERAPASVVGFLTRTIACDNLKDLHLHFTGEADPGGISTIRTFLPIDLTSLRVLRGPCYQVRKMDLVCCEAEPSFLQDTLDNLPALEQLRIAWSALTDDHLDVLVVHTPVAADAVRCPRLLSLTIQNELAVTSKVIARIALSRHKMSIPLRSIALHGLDLAHVVPHDLESIRSSGVFDLDITTLEEEESEAGPDCSEIWTSDSELEWGLDSGDEDVIS